jgi:translocator assembly and maintenance protein 41
MSTDQLLGSILHQLPDVDFGMAYGSGMFAQAGYSSDAPPPMIDMLFAVGDVQRWHEQNLKDNPSHYSPMRWLGPKGIAVLQENFGARIYYNTQVCLVSAPSKACLS